jgi:hypothetical protein
MQDWSGHCQRCGIKTSVHIMSWFNTSLICFSCSDKEAAHPSYNKAREAELKAVRSGDFNFEGIGYFSDKVNKRTTPSSTPCEVKNE